MNEREPQEFVLVAIEEVREPPVVYGDKDSEWVPRIARALQAIQATFELSIGAEFAMGLAARWQDALHRDGRTASDLET